MDLYVKQKEHGQVENIYTPVNFSSATGRLQILACFSWYEGLFFQLVIW